MIIDALNISLLTLAGIRLLGMLVFVHLYSQKRDKKYILLAAGWLCVAAGSILGLYTHVASGTMDHYFTSLLAGLGTFWIITGALLYFSVISWRHVYTGSIVIIVYGLLPLSGLSLGPSPGVLVQLLVSLLLTFIVIFRRRTLIGFARSSYFWLVLLAVLSDALTLAFALDIINTENMAIGFAGTSIVKLTAIIFFLHLEYNISMRSQQISEEKHRRLFENMTQGVVYQTADGKIFSANPAAERILGLTVDQMQGKTSMDPRWKMIREDGTEIPGTEHPAMQALRTGEMVGPLIRGVFHPEKSTYVWLFVTAIPLFQRGEKKAFQVYATFDDFTERKKTEDEIIALKDNLEKQVDKRTKELEEKVKKLDSSQKAMLYMVEDLNNLTAQLKEEQHKLLLSNKELEAFSYSVSHDLRSPLRHINGYVDLLNREFLDGLPEKAQHYLTTVADAAKQMGTLIDELLQFSRTSRQEVRKTKIEMAAMVNELIERIKQDTEKRKITFKVEELPPVFGDHSMLKQVWVNLLDNAVKYTRNTKKAEISVGFREEKKNFVFYVSDNGVGFDMKYAHKLFGVFQRLHSRSEFEGTGIGLANVQRIIHKHNGRVWAEAETGKGATFFFSLPKGDKLRPKK